MLSVTSGVGVVKDTHSTTMTIGVLERHLMILPLRNMN